MTDTVQDTVREVLVTVTGWIPGETVSGFVFGVALVVSDHVFNIWEASNV